MALKDLEIKYAARRSRDYKLFDGEGLYVLVTPRGSKLWRLKYFIDGKEKTLSLGKYPAVSAAVARQMRRDAKKLVADGIDPGEHRRSNKGMLPPQTLFEPIARAWHANRCEALDAAHASRVMSRLERDVFPALGKRAIKSITPPEVLEVVRAVEARGALDVSRRVKQSIGQVFRFAIASGWATNDPTTSINDALRPKPRVKHMPRVPLAELPELVAAILSYDGETDPRRRETTRDAMMFTLLTWARTSETRFASWDEFEDLDGEMPLWRLSPQRMKMDREHVVPLSTYAAELLRRRRRTSSGGYVFGGEKPGHPISENTMIFACYRMGYRGRQTVHGFRGLASTWANEAECFKSDWIEMALAHADENEVRGAYNSALYLSPRRRMLQRWAEEILVPPPPRTAAEPKKRVVSRERRPAPMPPPPGPRDEPSSGRHPGERTPFWRGTERQPVPRYRVSLPK